MPAGRCSAMRRPMGSARRRSRVALLLRRLRTILSVLFPVRFLFQPLARHCFGALAAPGACEASALPPAPFRFWLPRTGAPRKATSGLGSRAHSLPGARDRRAEQEKRMYLNRITLIGFLGSDD